MSNRVRSKGRFIKKSVLQKREKAILSMNEAKKEAAAAKARTAALAALGEEDEKENSCVGRRIVEVSELGENLICCQCKGTLSLKDIVHEKRLGLNSLLRIQCQNCSVLTEVSTGKVHKGNRKKCELSDVNTKAVLGAVHAGIGCTALNKLLACLNIPTISGNLFKRYEREVGSAIEEFARESCKRAAEEERRLVLENIEKLCKEL